MRKIGKRLSYASMGLASIVAIAITYTIGWRPFLGPRSRSLTARKCEATPERLARGRYLANRVTGSMHCHPKHDWKALGGPSVEAKRAAGQVFPESDLPGVVTAPNLTPDPETGAGSWSDRQFARTIREELATTKARASLSPHMSDIGPCPTKTSHRIVVYIRSLRQFAVPFPRRNLFSP